ncbi:MAG: N-acyl-D-amino-acid deacylase family protein [Henriciella sp.]
MRIPALFAAAMVALCGCQESADPPTLYDVQITGGLVFDGVSETGVSADVFIQDDKILFIGDGEAANLQGEMIIDASGLIVAPGFIDPHTHTTADVLFGTDAKKLTGYLTQGVTTVVSGNDGGGPTDIAGSFHAVEARGVGPNFALFTGHGSIRGEAMGRDNRPPSSEELAQMKDALRAALEAGALGLSTGLYYAPASYASTDEIIELAKVAAEFGALYESHIRDESTYSIGLLGAIEEAIEIGRQSGAPVHIAHIKALGVDVWGQSEAVIAAIEAAQADDIKISADQYPWSASGTRISNALIPNWAKADSDEAMFERLRAAENQDRLRTEIAENLRRRGGPDAILLVARAEGLPSRTLTEEAAALGLDPIQAAIEIVLGGDSRIASFNMQDQDIEQFMSQPWVMTSSDGTNGHPRKFASFPRKYRTYVVDKQVLSLAEFINRSTSLTANTLQLCQRGKLQAGYFADVVVFDPETFGPVADFSNPAELSTGIVHLFVNGAPTIKDGRVASHLNGRPLRRADCS